MDIFGIIFIAGIILAIVFPAFRKALGLLFVILGIIASLSLIGMIVGIPMILIGGIMLFAKRRSENEAPKWIPPIMRVDWQEKNKQSSIETD